MTRLFAAIALAAAILLFAGCSFGGAGSISDLDSVDVDVDIMSMSDTIMIAYLNVILDSPTDYEGRTVRITGNVFNRYNSDTGEYDYYCAVDDPMGCCSTRVLFRMADGDENYPEAGERVTIVGSVGVKADGASGYLNDIRYELTGSDSRE